MSESRINVELFERVKAHILEEPRRYFQPLYSIQSRESPCGTACCIYGWGAILSGLVSLEQIQRDGFSSLPDDWVEEVSKRFGFTGAEANVVVDMDASTWPHPFNEQYALATSAAERARAAANFIDHIVTTGKVTD